MSAALASWLGFRRSAPAARDLLTPVQIRCLGALLLAAQLPQAPHLPIWVAAVGVMLVGVRILLLRRDRLRPQAQPGRIPSWALILFAIAAALAVRKSFGVLISRDPCVAFLYILVAIKYLEARTARDGTLLVCLACFLLVAPFFYSQSLFAALAAVPAVLLVGASLDVLADPTANARPFAWRAALRRSGVMMLQGLPVAALLFVLFPRLAQPLWGLPSDVGAQTGLSDSMAPGGISKLSQSDAVAFRVDFEGAVPPPSTRYWRGPVFSRFDGRTWSPGYTMLREGSAPASGAGIVYSVTLEPTNRRSLFALDLPADLPTFAEGTLPPGSGGPYLTQDEQILLRGPVSQLVRYTQRSILRSQYPATPNLETRLNLTLGEGNARTIEFARELRAQSANDAAFINAVLAKFRNEEFIYTLEPPLLGANPVDQFLFDVRAGFCEHYASAFALMLRAAGIPARIVTGYQGGFLNPRGSYMIVRQSDAHAWVEAMLDGQWRRFDPTAAVAPSRIELGLGGALAASDRLPFLARLDINWLGNLQLTWDAFNYDWRRNVIGFNRDRQRTLWRDWRLDQFAPWQVVALISLAVFAWGGLVVGWLMWKRRHQERALVLWDDLNRRLARAGLPRYQYEGPLAFAARAAQRWPQFAIAFAAIGGSFAELRYGRMPVLRERDALVATLERAIEVLPAPATLRRAA
jgi:transglutaminase-like putative cysteine protease